MTNNIRYIVPNTVIRIKGSIEAAPQGGNAPVNTPVNMAPTNK